MSAHASSTLARLTKEELIEAVIARTNDLRDSSDLMTTSERQSLCREINYHLAELLPRIGYLLYERLEAEFTRARRVRR